MTRVLAYIEDGELRDLEYILPVLFGLESSGVETTVFFPFNQDITNPPPLVILAQRVCSLPPQDIKALEGLPSKLADRIYSASEQSTLWAKIFRIYTHSTNRVGSALGIAKWRSSRLTRNFSSALKDVDIILVGRPLNSDEANSYNPIQLLLNAAKDTSAQIVGFQYAQSEVPLNSIEIQHLAAATSLRDELPGPKPSCVLGSPRYHADWQAFVRGALNSRIEAIDVTGLADSTLVILKNEYSPVWSGLDFEEETRRLLVNLAYQSSFLILKPHPRSDRDVLKRILRSLPEGSYVIDDRPISFWAGICKRCVAQLSSAVLDFLASGNIPEIWLPDHARTKLQEAVQSQPDAFPTIFRNGGLFQNYYESFCHVVDSNGRITVFAPQDIHQRFADTFKPVSPKTAGKALLDLCIPDFVSRPAFPSADNQ